MNKVNLKYKWQSLDCSKAQIELDGVDVGTHEIDDEDFYKWYFEWLGFRTVDRFYKIENEKDIFLRLSPEYYTCGDGCCVEWYFHMRIGRDHEVYTTIRDGESVYPHLLKWLGIELKLDDDSDYEEVEE